MFSPSRDDNLMLVFCDCLWKFFSFLLCLVSHSAPAEWDLNPFPARSKLLERLKRRSYLVSCCGLSPCLGPLLLPAANHCSQCPGLRRAWLPGTACCLPIQAFHPCHQYLACIDGCQWLSEAGKHLAEFSPGFKNCFDCSCSGHSSAGQQMW